MAVAAVAVTTWHVTSFAVTSSPADSLNPARKIPSEPKEAEIEASVRNLEQMLRTCRDPNAAYKIRYTKATLYFRANRMEQSKSEFDRIVHEPHCPNSITIYACNMIGQIAQIQEEYPQALDTFDRTAKLVQQYVSADVNDPNNAALIHVGASALLARARICFLDENYSAALSEYDRLLSAQDHFKWPQEYAAMALDHIGQLHLRQHNIEKYFETAQRLTTSHPRYYRTPLVALESECVKLLLAVGHPCDFTCGALNAPAAVIEYFKEPLNRASASDISEKFRTLIRRYPMGYGTFLLQYHYAWLLDTLGRKDEAEAIFAGISGSELLDISPGSPQKIIIDTIRQYAKIQYAILLAEKADYKSSEKILSTVQSGPHNSHLSKLTQSVIENVQILKREVSGHDNKKQ